MPLVACVPLLKLLTGSPFRAILWVSITSWPSSLGLGMAPRDYLPESDALFPVGFP